MEWVTRIVWPGWNGVIEIAVLAAVFYFILLFISGTRGAQVLSGLIVVLVSLAGLTWFFQLDTLTWLLQRFTAFLAVALLIIFQPEIRRALAELGRRHIFASSVSERPLHDLLVRAVTQLAEQKIGALIAVEREVGIRTVVENGVDLDAVATPELLVSLFYPGSPLHDGGVVLKDGRVVAAGCVFPLTQRNELSKQLGTRHRAAIGLTEETDAFVLVVSEETGTISIAYRGRLRRGFDEARLTRVLQSILGRGRRKEVDGRTRSAFARLLRSFWPRPAGVAPPKVEDHVQRP